METASLSCQKPALQRGHRGLDQGRLPVGDERDRRISLRRNRIDEKALAVGGYVPTARRRADFEQRPYGADFELRGPAVYRSRYEPSVRRLVKYLAAIMLPTRSDAPGGGDSPLPPGPGKGATYTSVRPGSFDWYATHRPSGENLPSASLNVVCKNGNGFRSPKSGWIHRSCPVREVNRPVP